MASRILGMGDVLSLIERAQENFDTDKAMELEKKLRTQDFTFEDFLDQLQQVKNLGPMNELLGMIPGVNSKQLKDIDVGEKDFKRLEAIIQSMTVEERKNPTLIDSSRRKRIATGSGTKIQDVNKLLKQFKETKKMMKQFTDMEKTMKKKGKFSLPFLK